MKPHLILLAVALSSTQACAADLRFSCQDRYQGREPERAGSPPGWTGAPFTASPSLAVSGAGMITGTPAQEQRGSLRANGIQLNGNATEQRYAVGAGESWAYCSYGEHGDIQVFRRIPAGELKECSVRYTRAIWPTPVKVEFACR